MMVVVRYRLRLFLLSLFVVVGFSALGVRLWSIQIDRHREFLDLIPGTSTVSQRVPGVRGEIKDRNGITLATNKPSYVVTLNLDDIEKAYRVGRSKDEIPMIEYPVRERGVLRTRKEPDMGKIVQEEVITALEELGLAVPVNPRRLQIHYRSKRGIVPFIYREDLTFDEFAMLAEHNLRLPGVNVTVRPMREYPFGSLAAHILGFVRSAEEKVPEEEKGKYQFYVGDDFGVAGVEKTMDAALRGKPGKRILLKNEKKSIVGDAGYEEPKRGSDVYLTIDARVQYVAEEVLRQAGLGRASAVVLDPTTGEVLGMASVPSYNPNRFIPSITPDEWAAYRDDATEPFTNRAITPSAPGSTFKIPIGLAACLSGVDSKSFFCSGGVHYGGRSYMRCWISPGKHRSISLPYALKTSCNAYFYQAGNATGIRRIETVCSLMGLGRKTGVRLPNEHGGRVPGPDWLRRQRKGNWTPALTALVSIGQGDTEATPLQMAMATGTVAIGGKCFQPQIISRAVDRAADSETRFPPILRSDLIKEGISPKKIERIRSGMWKVVNEGGGTGRRAYNGTYITAGKTGTAQVKRRIDGKMRKDNHAWFVCFAPYDEPRVAVCVRVEGGDSGGKVAAPIAARLVKETLALDDGKEISVRPMPEAPGHFTFLESITFDNSPVVAEAEEDGDTGSHVATARISQTGIPADAPEAPRMRDETILRAFPSENEGQRGNSTVPERPWDGRR